MRQGFALIDLLVSIMISSIMSTVLFTMIFQLQKTENSINEVVSTSMQAALVYERLQKDLTGLFWPQFMPEKSEAKSDTKKEQQVGTKFKIAKILYSQNARYDNLEILAECSFITNNPLQVYNESNPRVARVIYTLVPESEYAGSFELRRQQACELDYQAVKKNAQTFVVISGIKSLKFTYFYQDQAKNQDDMAQDQLNLIKRDELDYDETGQIITDENSLTGQVPAYIKVDLVLWSDSDHQDLKEFEFWFYIYASAPKNQKNFPDQTSGKVKNETK